MPQVFSTVLLCILLAAALFFSVRKLWKDKKAENPAVEEAAPAARAALPTVKKVILK